MAIGIAVGARVMRRYANRHGVADSDVRGMTACVAIVGLVGAHVLDLLIYRPGEVTSDPLALVEFWKGGISSWGGFVAGALGFGYYLWRKRLRLGLWADITTVGLLVAFSIGRVGCASVHDHIGSATDAAFGFDFPRHALAARGLLDHFASAEPVIRAHDVAFYELLYLIPVNALVLWLAFRGKRRSAGFLTVVTGMLYAPVRFCLEFLRLDETDPLYAGLTFAQWCSIAAFAIAVVAAAWLVRAGRPAPLTAELAGEIGGRRPVAAPS